MTGYQRPPHVDVPSIGAWQYTAGRLLERYLGFQALMYIFIIVLSSYLFGFTIRGWSSGVMLFCNFLVFLAIIAVMYCMPLISRRLIGRGYPWQADMLAEIDTEDDDEERDFLILEARLNGGLPPSRKQETALLLIAVILLFEAFYIHAWTPNGELIWYPEWLQHLVAWMKDHSGIYPEDIRKKFFILDFEFSPKLAELFPDERTFLAAAASDRYFAFALFRIVTFPVVFYCLCIAGWDIVNYLGVERLKPIRARSDERRLVLFLITAFMTLLGFVGLFMLIWFPVLNMENVIDHGSTMMYLMMHILALIALELLYGWWRYFRHKA